MLKHYNMPKHSVCDSHSVYLRCSYSTAATRPHHALDFESSPARLQQIQKCRQTEIKQEQELLDLAQQSKASNEILKLSEAQNEATTESLCEIICILSRSLSEEHAENQNLKKLVASLVKGQDSLVADAVPHK